jgi:pyroglutamyl-peptidase
MTSKLLVTGFQPFLNETVNPSGLLLEALAPEFSQQIETLLLPVSYKKSASTLRARWKAKGPYRGLLMLGQAAGRKAVCLERVALNWSETSIADEDGERLKPGPLRPEAPSAVISEFFPSSWKDLLNAEGPTEISFSAGTYVCNSIYFEALSRLCADKTPALFVHVPYLPEQTLTKPEQPSLSFEIQKKILRRLIQLMHEHLVDSI